jgi:hypothetical protein
MEKLPKTLRELLQNFSPLQSASDHAVGKAQKFPQVEHRHSQLESFGLSSFSCRLVPGASLRGKGEAPMCQLSWGPLSMTWGPNLKLAVMGERAEKATLGKAPS